MPNLDEVQSSDMGAAFPGDRYETELADMDSENEAAMAQNRLTRMHEELDKAGPLGQMLNTQMAVKQGFDNGVGDAIKNIPASMLFGTWEFMRQGAERLVDIGASTAIDSMQQPNPIVEAVSPLAKKTGEVVRSTIAADSTPAASAARDANAIAAAPTLPESAGLLTPGNVEPWDRKILNNPDGSISTASSMSFEENGKEILVPTVIDGVRLSNEDAIAHYHKTGEHLGMFSDPSSADAYAQELHNRQDAYVRSNKDPGPNLGDPSSFDMKDIFPELTSSVDQIVSDYKNTIYSGGPSDFTNTAEKMVQFMVPFSIGLGMSGGVDKISSFSSFATNAVKLEGASAGAALFMAPHDSRFADLLKEMEPSGYLLNKWIDLAASDPSDTEAEGVFKNVVDNAFAGIPLTILGEGLAGYKPVVEFGAKALRDIRKNWDQMPAMSVGGPAAQRGSISLRPAAADEPAPTFYSAAGKAAQESSLTKAPPEQWLSTLKNTPGVKPEELDWLGVEEAFKGQKSVTKEQMTEYMKANELQVEDVVLGEMAINRKSKYAIPEVERAIRDAGGNEGELSLTLANDGDAYRALTKKFPDLIENENWADVVASDVFGGLSKPSGTVKFGNYQTPGGENYREVLLKLPSGAPIGKFYVLDASGKEVWRGTTQAEAVDQAQEIGGRVFITSKGKSTDPADFTGGHFDQPNVLAHVRFNERTDTSGSKVLFLEEVQSDWHQRGRKQGYAKSTAGWTAQRLNDPDAGFNHWQINDADGNPVTKIVGGTEEGAIRKAGEGIPDAPFKTSWPELSLKRMIRWAAEHGQDKIAWTTGEMQAERYDLSKQIDSLHYDPENKQLSARKGSQQVIKEQDVPPEKIADYVGKDAAEKLLATTLNGAGNHQLTGVELKVGGEGMKGFYDKILPAAANKLGKKYGAKVEETTILTEPTTAKGQIKIAGAGKQPVVVHSIKITPELKKAALSGQPLFSAAGAGALLADQMPQKEGQ